MVLVLFSIFLGYSFGFPKETNENLEDKISEEKEILKVALIADSHNENELLSKALTEAKNRNVNFVIGLGDYTNLGTKPELEDAKRVFDESGLRYFALPGDRDGWESRSQGTDNFKDIFGETNIILMEEWIEFVLLDNSDIYNGIDADGWDLLDALSRIGIGTFGTADTSKMRFVFAHKTPFHPDSAHIMGEDSPEVAAQAQELLKILDEKDVDGFFSGDMHFFARFTSPSGSVKITTVGAVASERNFQGPRFSILKVYGDWRWEVEDIAI